MVEAKTDLVHLQGKDGQEWFPRVARRSITLPDFQFLTFRSTM